MKLRVLKRVSVAFSGLERQFIDDFNAIIDPLHKKDIKLSHVYGVTNGLGFSLQYFIYAAAFRLATELIVNGKLEEPADAFKVIFALLFAAFGVGQSTAFFPDFAKAQVAAQNISTQLGLQPVIGGDSRSTKDARGLKGNIKFDNIQLVHSLTTIRLKPKYLRLLFRIMLLQFCVSCSA